MTGNTTSPRGLFKEIEHRALPRLSFTWRNVVYFEDELRAVRVHFTLKYRSWARRKGPAVQYGRGRLMCCVQWTTDMSARIGRRGH